MFDIVSAVVINRNRKRDLKECIESIQRQTYGTTELVVIDNDSDETPAWTTIKLPYNMGVTLPTNIGVASSIGKYILLVDNDAILDEKFLENAIYIMDNNPDIGVIAGRIFKFGTHEDLDYEVTYASPVPPDTPQLVGNFYACACLIRRTCWDEVRGYNEKYCAYYQEPDFAARIINKGWLLYYEPLCIAWHKVTSEQRDKSVMVYFQTRNQQLFIWQHLPLSYAILQSCKGIVWSIWKGRHHPYTVLRAFLGVVALIPFSIRDREPVDDKLFLRPWRKISWERFDIWKQY